MAAAVEVDGLSKAYGDVQALRGVSFEVRQGECVGLLGPNGAGKSTLMAILATLRKPDAGHARVAGASVTEAPGEVRHRIGVVFQEPLISKHLTAREVLLHHARLYNIGKTDREARADELLDLVDLTDRADDRVSGFSGGMGRRLDLARVLMTRPQVLLLDEPTAGLDLRGRREVQDHIRALVDQGTTVLLATHDLEEAHRLAGRVAILDQGQLLADGTPTQLAHQMGHRVVRVALPSQATGQAARQARRALEGLGELLDTGDGFELILGDETDQTTAGRVVDRLDEAGIAYDTVTVREPDLGDVFLGLTGRSLAGAPEGGEGP